MRVEVDIPPPNDSNFKFWAEVLGIPVSEVLLSAALEWLEMQDRDKLVTLSEDQLIKRLAQLRNDTPENIRVQLLQIKERGAYMNLRDIAFIEVSYWQVKRKLGGEAQSQ